MELMMHPISFFVGAFSPLMLHSDVEKSAAHRHYCDCGVNLRPSSPDSNPTDLEYVGYIS